MLTAVRAQGQAACALPERTGPQARGGRAGRRADDTGEGGPARGGGCYGVSAIVSSVASCTACSLNAHGSCSPSAHISAWST